MLAGILIAAGIVIVLNAAAAVFLLVHYAREQRRAGR